MKKSSMIGGILIAIGVLAIVISFAMAGCKFKNYISEGKNSFVHTSEEYIEKEYTAKADIDKLVLDGSSDAVKVVTGDVDKVEVVYYESETQKYDISEENGKLKITRKENQGVQIGFWFDVDFKDHTMTVTLPESFDGEIKADYSSGAVSVKNVNTEKLTVKCTSGAINVEDVKVKNDAFIKASSGAINVNGVTAKNFDCEASSGAVNVENIECDDFNSKCNSGLLRLSDINAENVEFSATSGEIILTRIDAEKAIKGKCTSGDIRGTIVGKEDDFSIIADTTSGSCNLSNSRSGDKTLDLEATSGDISIRFEK